MPTEMKTLTCPGPPEHEFQIPKGRGRPPRFCEEHDPKKNGNGKGESKVSEKTREAPTRGRPGPPGKRPSPPTGGGEKPKEIGEQTQPRQGPPRRAPRIQPGPPHSHLDEPIPQKSEGEKGDEDNSKAGLDEGVKRLPPPGRSDVQSRAKAENAANQAQRQQPDTDNSWPRGVQGRPMAKIEFSASELIPTGQYANVSVGPARITAFIDLDRAVVSGESYFSDTESENLIRALNELAEKVEGDVIAVQRNLVLESIQEQLSQNGN